jgi:hypothetical protein
MIRGGSVFMKGGTKAQVSDALRERGSPGVQYLDGVSRAAGQGSRNYVMFDDKLVDILKRYALPVGIAGAVAIVGERHYEAYAEANAEAPFQGGHEEAQAVEEVAVTQL